MVLPQSVAPSAILGGQTRDSIGGAGHDDPHGRNRRRAARIGGVITYSALARRVGAPNAVGAVANACAECPIVLAISGDRVVRTGGAARLSKQEPEFGSLLRSVSPCLDRRKVTVILTRANGENRMNNEEGNKAVVGRWFTEFWGKDVNLAVVDEIAAPDMLLKYSLHEPRRGRADIKAFMTDFRAAFPDLNFWGTADLIAEGDHVVGQWEGGGTHTGPAFNDFLVGGLPAATGRKMRFSGTTVLKVLNGKIVEEVGLDDGVTALTQLGLIKAA